MSNPNDIIVRIRTDYTSAVDGVRRFASESGRAMSALPGAAARTGGIIDALTGQAVRSGNDMRTALTGAFDSLPAAARAAAAPVDSLSSKLSAVGAGGAPGVRLVSTQLGQMAASTAQHGAMVDRITGRAVKDAQQLGSAYQTTGGAMVSAMMRAATAADGTYRRVSRLGDGAAPRALSAQIASATSTMTILGAVADDVAPRLAKLGDTGPVSRLRADLSQLSPVMQQLIGTLDRLDSKIDQLGSGSPLRPLNDELDGANRRAGALARTFGAVRTAATVAAAGAGAITAAKMVVDPHVDRMVDYDTQLAHLVNVGYAGKSVAERLAGKDELNKVVLGATREGGGTRDSALETLGKLMGSGTVSDKDAKAMLPTIMKAATASGAGADQIADIGIRAMQNFGFKAEQLPRVIDMAIRSGNMGGFELRDMAKWLPEQMAAAASLGMKGERGFSQLLALNQASITTSGSTDAAGNNVINLLSKINGSDTQADFKRQKIDLAGSLQAAAAKGIDPITAFSGLIDKVMSRDKTYVALERKIASAKSDSERGKLLEQQLQLAEGTAVGKILQDRQARTAFLGYKQQGDKVRTQVDDVLRTDKQALQGNFDVMASSPGFKRQQSDNERLNAQNEAMRKLLPTLGSLWDGTSKLAKEYPVLSTAIEGGRIGVTSLAAGAGAASIIMTLLTKNAAAAAGALGGVAGSGLGKTLTGGAYGARMGMLGRMGHVGAALAGGWEIGSALNSHVLNPLAEKVGGYKGATMGTLLFDATHKQPALAAATATTAATATPLQRQLAGSAAEVPNMQRAVQQGFRMENIKADIGLKIGFDESMRPVVKQQSVVARGVDLSTGVMMTH